ncbi:restriction endonuclease [Helicobacter anatolicus]|uniref:restriction endonuclease n=1 Tax=Helicobacter anatolicus TaxID=2905874 RepID=UPI001E4FD09B|nr:restriction endonuclease [Helicobacter anatolicus]MCE3040297.1 restriction endonuclease [Helicobacter anatolicus]
MFNETNFKEYRFKMGYTRQDAFKKFLSAKDISASIDFDYINALNKRLIEVFTTINNVYYHPQNIDSFLREKLFKTYDILKEQGILNRLNNQGRRKEEVYFNWMRGYLSCEYFKAAVAEIFNIDVYKIKDIGDDDFSNLDSFKRTPRADLEIEGVCVEIQSGFQGINDIKEHKVREAKRLYNETQMRTLVIHIDFFNGQVAFVDISNICDNDLRWITRQQMEGQTVFNVDQSFFRWLLWKNPPSKSEVFGHLH